MNQWLTDHGVIPVAYGDGVEGRIRAASGGKVDAFVDTFGGGYVELAIKLGVAINRIDTIIDWAAAEKYHVKTDGNAAAANAGVLGQLAGLVAAGKLEIPIAKVYPLSKVREAYQELEQRHTRGKIVLEREVSFAIGLDRPDRPCRGFLSRKTTPRRLCQIIVIAKLL